MHKPQDGTRRSTRSKKVSERMSVVDEASRQQAAQARLDALENDNDVPDAFGLGDDEDDEFVLNEDDDEDHEPIGKKRGKKARAGVKRKITRGAQDRWGPRTFTRLLEESGLESDNSGKPNYLTAAAGPPQHAAPRKFCSVCGSSSTYTCARCGLRYCCKRCYVTHTETRCLKFMV